MLHRRYKSTMIVNERVASNRIIQALGNRDGRDRASERAVAIVTDKRTRKMVEGKREKREENLYLESRLEKPFLDFLPRDPRCIPFPLPPREERILRDSETTVSDPFLPSSPPQENLNE